MIRALIHTAWFASLAVTASAQTLSFTPVGSIALPADMVEVSGRHAYLAAGNTITVVDVSNPAAPKRVGAYASADRIWGFRVVGSLVYVAADLHGLEIVDVSNPAAPKLRGSYKTHGQAHAVDVVGTTALVIDHMLGVAFFDISNLAKPVATGSVFLDGYARHVAIFDSMAYAVDSPNGFYVVDPSKPPSEPLGVLQSPDSGYGRIISIAVTDPSLGSKIAAVTGGRSLQVYDVSKPAAPVLVARLRTPGGGQRMAMKGRLAYVADLEAGLQVVDLSTPAKPRIIGAHKTSSHALDVAVADSLVFVVAGHKWDENGRRFEGEELIVLRQAP
jgi:hypothetical protein